MNEDWLLSLKYLLRENEMNYSFLNPEIGIAIKKIFGPRLLLPEVWLTAEN